MRPVIEPSLCGQVTGGAWSTQPSRVPGASTLNFFLDFPDAAARNDVSLPAGRVFLSSACWESEEAMPPGLLEGEISMPQRREGTSALDDETAGAVRGPGGVLMLDKGGLSIKNTGPSNFWGLLGEGFLIFGRFSVLGPSLPSSTSGTPSSDAASDAPSDAPSDVANALARLAGAQARATEAEELEAAKEALELREAQLKMLNAELLKREEALRKAKGGDAEDGPPRRGSD
jgi:hypothetical protein